MNSKVSVIVAVFNEEKYLHKCIQSVLNQTYVNFELILVNDGSTDGSKEIIEEYVKQFPNKVKHIEKKNGGLSSARNCGMQIMSGEFVTFLDADDYIDCKYLEILVRTAEQCDCDVVCSGQYKVDESGNIAKAILFPAIEGKCLTRRLNISGKVYRTEYLKEWDIHFPEGKTYEDNSFNLQALFLSNSNYFLEYAGYYQVVHEGSITSKPIQIETLPLGEWKYCIEKILRHCTNIENKELFEFTVISFFTYFLLIRNRKREYLSNCSQKNERNNAEEIAEYFQGIIREYFPEARKNRFASLWKYKELPFSQRAGVKAFAWLCYFKQAVNFTKFFYRIAGNFNV